MTGQQLYDLLFHVKCYHGHLCGYAELKENVTFRHWQGHGTDPEFIEEQVPTGITVKVVMASRFGDLGITKNMDKDHGYECRVKPDLLKNCRLTEGNLVRGIESGWNWKLETWHIETVKDKITKLLIQYIKKEK